MKSIVALLLILFFFTSCAPKKQHVARQVFDISNRVAVIPFGGDSGPIPQELTNAVVDRLVNSGFAVVERSALARVFQEQSLNYSGQVDPATAAEMGRLAGVDYLIIGSIKTRQATSLLEWLVGEGRSVDQIELVQVRWVNVRDGRVVASASYRNRSGGTVERVAERLTDAFVGMVR